MGVTARTSSLKPSILFLDALHGGSGAAGRGWGRRGELLGVILTGAEEEEGPSSVKMGFPRRLYLQGGESSLPEWLSPAQR